MINLFRNFKKDNIIRIEKPNYDYIFNNYNTNKIDEQDIINNQELIIKIANNFGVTLTPKGYDVGSNIIRIKFQLGQGIKINKVRTQYNQGQISEVEKEKQILFAKLYSLEGLVFEQDAHIIKEEDGIRITDRNNNVFIDNKANIKVGNRIYEYQVQK